MVQILRALTLAFIIIIQAMASSPPVLANPQIAQIGCDTLSLVPPLVRIEFGVVNLGEVPVCGLRLTPIQSGSIPADSCHIMDCGSAPGWSCRLLSNGRALWEGDVDPGSGDQICVDQGETHEPFSVVLDPLSCCYSAAFFAPAILEPFHVDTVCFECDKPVQTLSHTWGRVKSIYR